MANGEKYSLTTAICMVVGSVIGSGVFFKAETICRITDANMPVAVAAWSAGGIVMLLCLICFAFITSSCNAPEGLCLLARRLVGDRYSYCVGWFTATVYYPSLVGTLAWLAARYTLIFSGQEKNQVLCILLAATYLVVSFLQNTFLPKFSGKFQIVTTFAKLVPLVLMIIMGTLKGSFSGLLFENIAYRGDIPREKTFFPAVVASLFAYEGWITATSIGGDLKNSRKNLPVALLTGGIIIFGVYVLYYVGIMGAVKGSVLINYGAEGINMAFSEILGEWGRLLTAFVALSCVGALNALVMGCKRAGEEILPLVGKTRKSCAPPVVGAILSLLWLMYLFATQNTTNLRGFTFDVTALPVVTIYVFYIPIFWGFARMYKTFKSLLVCAGGVVSSLFALLCGMVAQRGEIVSYLCFLISTMLVGSLLYKKTE